MPKCGAKEKFGNGTIQKLQEEPLFIRFRGFPVEARQMDGSHGIVIFHERLRHQKTVNLIKVLLLRRGVTRDVLWVHVVFGRGSEHPLAVAT